jgi:hypothetical protein
MMERLRDTTANAQTVEQMRSLLEGAPPYRYMPMLRKYAREKIDGGYSNEQLYTDLRHLYHDVSGHGNEDMEEAIADVMDFLTGVCGPDARLY